MVDNGRLRVDVAPHHFELTPGETFEITVAVFNGGPIIDSFAVTLIGFDRTFVTSDPPSVSLFPGAEETMLVRATLPKGYPAGAGNLGVKVASTTDDSVFVVEDLVIEVLPVTAADITLSPTSVSGGRKARFGVLVENYGNVPLDVTLHGRDPEQHLEFDFTPRRLSVASGTSAAAQLTVRGRRHLIGVREPRPLTVYAEGSAFPLETMGTFVQLPWFARGILTVAAFGIILGLWALVLVFGVDAIIDDTESDQANAELRTENDDLKAQLAADRQANAAELARIEEAAMQPGSISGTVTAASTGELVDGVTVVVESSAGDTVGTTVTSSGGLYVISDLNSGSYSLSFQAVGYTKVVADGIVLPEDQPTAHNEVLFGLPAAISGTVAGETGPLSGVVVSVSGTGLDSPATDTTSDAGEFEVGNLATPGDYLVSISTGDYGTDTFPVRLEAGTPATVERTLVAGAGSLVGSVVADGNGLGGVAVEASGGGTVISTVTLTGDNAGTYFLSGLPPGKYALTFTAPGFVSETREIDLEAGEKELEVPVVELTGDPTIPAGTISGVVEGPDGPLAEVLATLNGPSETTPTAVTDNDGVYAAANLLAGGYTITFTKPGFVTKAIQLELGPGDTSADNNVVLQRSSGSISGTVEGPDGSLGGVTITASGGPGGGSTVSLTEGGGLGSYTLTSLASGTYALTFTMPGYVAATISVDLLPGEDKTENVTLERVGRTITGEVVDGGPIGGPLAGAIVTLSGGEASLATVTGPAGAFLLDAVPDGAHLLTFSKDGFVAMTMAITVTDDADVGTVTLQPADTLLGSIEGIVTAAGSGTPLGGILVTVFGNATSLATISLTGPPASVGEYSISGLEPGDYTISFTHPDYITWVEATTVAAGSVPSTINVSLVPRGPVVAIPTTALTVDEQVATFIAPAAEVTDGDDTHLVGATVRITTNFVTGEDVLAYVGSPSISAVWDPASGLLTLDGVDTVAKYQAALRNVTYENTVDAPSILDRAIELRASDGTFVSGPATVVITVNPVNDAPSLTPVADVTVAEGGSAPFTATASDPDGDPIALTVSPALPGFASFTDNGDGTASVTIDPGFDDDGGYGPFTVTASDGDLTDTDPFSITVTNTNRAPVLSPVADVSVAEGGSAPFTVTASDPDGDPITLTVSPALPPFASFTDNGDGTASVTVDPDFEETGVYGPFTVTASDGDLTDTDPFSITVTNTNRAPVLAPVADVSVAEGGSAPFTVTASDPDGDPITLTVSPALPGFASFTDNGDGTASVTVDPGFDDDGVYGPFTVTASDGDLTDTDPFSITVTNTNRAPVLAPVADVSVAEGGSAPFTVTASDPDGDPITLTVSPALPGFASFTDNGDGTASVTIDPVAGDAGGYGPFTVTASDGDLTDTDPFSITVT